MRKFYVRKLEERIPTKYDTPMVVEETEKGKRYKGKILTEADLDALLAERNTIPGCPDVLLIEEGEENDETTKDAVGDSNGL